MHGVASPSGRARTCRRRAGPLEDPRRPERIYYSAGIVLYEMLSGRGDALRERTAVASSSSAKIKSTPPRRLIRASLPSGAARLSTRSFLYAPSPRIRPRASARPSRWARRSAARSASPRRSSGARRPTSPARRRRSLDRRDPVPGRAFAARHAAGRLSQGSRRCATRWRAGTRPRRCAGPSSCNAPTSAPCKALGAAARLATTPVRARGALVAGLALVA